MKNSFSPLIRAGHARKLLNNRSPKRPDAEWSTAVPLPFHFRALGSTFGCVDPWKAVTPKNPVGLHDLGSSLRWTIMKQVLFAAYGSLGRIVPCRNPTVPARCIYLFYFLSASSGVISPRLWVKPLRDRPGERCGCLWWGKFSRYLPKNSYFPSPLHASSRKQRRSAFGKPLALRAT